MVATFVEIIVGVRLTDREACKRFLNMSEEEYNKNAEELDDRVFSNFEVKDKSLLPNGCKVFQCICCSDTTDVIVGYSLRKIFRIKDKRCDKCSKYTLCEECFNTTEQGIIDYDETYSFKYELSPYEVCTECLSYNKDGKEGVECTTCSSPLKEFKKRTILGRESSIYFHWNDCCSCT